MNFTSSLDQGEAAGTGILISSSGLVLTNNHVIASANELEAEIGGDGYAAPGEGARLRHPERRRARADRRTCPASTPPAWATRRRLQIGDAIVAIGNAGGKGGAPSVVSGTVTGLDQQITASDQDGSNAETLHGLIQIDANIQPGDSGGPLVDANGEVVGMDAARPSATAERQRRLRLRRCSQNEGYAIPIEDALAIGKQIQAGNGTDSIHVGAHAGILGVSIQPTPAPTATATPSAATATSVATPAQGNGSGNGASVAGVQSGSGADEAGIQDRRHHRRHRRHDHHVGLAADAHDGAVRPRRHGEGPVARLLGPEPQRDRRARFGSPRLTPAH